MSEIEKNLLNEPRYLWLKDMVAQSLWSALMAGRQGGHIIPYEDEEFEECINIALADAFNLGYKQGTKMMHTLNEELNDIEACIPINTDTRLY